MSTPTAASPLHDLVDRLEQVSALDAPGEFLGKRVRGTVGPGPLKDLLSGTALGHAVHPLLTDVVIGAWTSAGILDLIGGAESDAAIRKLIAVGIAAYPPTAVTGFTDWADTEIGNDPVRRVGLIHAWTNALGLGLYTASLLARRRGDRGRGKLLSLAGLGTVSAGGFLGGHLAFRRGVGVDQTVFDPGSGQWTSAGDGGAPAEGESTVVQAGDTPVFVHRSGGTLHGLHDRCSHRGCSLGQYGEVADGKVTCNCHGSVFRLADGGLERGPATAPQPAFEVRESGAGLEVRLRG